MIRRGEGEKNEIMRIFGNFATIPNTLVNRGMQLCHSISSTFPETFLPLVYRCDATWQVSFRFLQEPVPDLSE